LLIIFDCLEIIVWLVAYVLLIGNKIDDLG